MKKLLASRKACGIGLLAIALVVVGLLLQGPVLTLVGEFLVVEDPLERADVIVVLSSGEPDRPLEAARLFQQGYSGNVVLTNPIREYAQEYADLGIQPPSDQEVYNLVLLKSGVPQEAISLLRPQVETTFEEATLVASYLAERDWRSLILVTSRYHTRRACMTFKALVAGGVKVICRGSSFDKYDPARWWVVSRYRKAVLLEYLGLVLYRWRLLTHAS
jgi:uncharacterized SAM-binding protein YcdF (DUF218 family)